MAKAIKKAVEAPVEAKPVTNGKRELEQLDTIDGYMTLQKASEVSTVGIQTLTKFINEGKLPAVKFGKLYLIREEAVASIVNIRNESKDRANYKIGSAVRLPIICPHCEETIESIGE